MARKQRAPESEGTITSPSWTYLIQLTEWRLQRIRLKEEQLTSLLATMRRQAAAGEPSPLDIARGISERIVVDARWRCVYCGEEFDAERPDAVSIGPYSEVHACCLLEMWRQERLKSARCPRLD